MNGPIGRHPEDKRGHGKQGTPYEQLGSQDNTEQSSNRAPKRHRSGVQHFISSEAIVADDEETSEDDDEDDYNDFISPNLESASSFQQCGAGDSEVDVGSRPLTTESGYYAHHLPPH